MAGGEEVPRSLAAYLPHPSPSLIPLQTSENEASIPWPEAKILGFSHDPRTVSQLALSWGTTPVLLSSKGTREEMIADAMRVATAEGVVRSGDQVAILAGDGVGAKVTNNLRIAQVP